MRARSAWPRRSSGCSVTAPRGRRNCGACARCATRSASPGRRDGWPRRSRVRWGDGMDERRAIICLPTYDERENLAAIVAAIHAVVPAVDVLVIDDNSPDGTGRLADQLAARDPRVQGLHDP